MCGCKKSIQSVQANESFEINEDCVYTLESLNEYKNKLYCIKDNESYTQYNTTEPTINSYIGITTSAIYYPNNLCYYESSLEEIKSFLEPLDLSNCNDNL